MDYNPQLKEILHPKLNKYIPHTPTPKQSAFLWLSNLEAFYGGAAGGGKSDALLMAALQYVEIPGYHAILIRDTFKNLTEPGALMSRSDEWLAGTDAKWRDKRWEFPSGATVSFGYLDGPRDHFNFQSSEFQFVGLDELVNIRKNQAIYMFSRLRKLTSEAYLNNLRTFPKYKAFTDEEIDAFYRLYETIPLRFRCASNPPTQEQMSRGSWVKEKYVDERTRDKSVIFIPAWMKDNPYLEKDGYEKSLSKLDPVTRKQLKEGDWDIRVKGRMFDRSWFEIVNEAPAGVQQVRYWDLAATEKTEDNEPCYSAGVKMSVKDGIYYVESVIRFQKSPRQVELIIRQTADMDGKNVHVYMEQEPGSGGVNTIDNYRRKVLPEFVFKGRKKITSKLEDAAPFSSQAEAGNVKLVKGHWNNEFLEESEVFPDGKFKDQIDAASGAFRELASPVTARIRTI